MVPNNSAKTPLIQRIFDSFGSDHTVTPTPHYHSQDEVNGLESALAGKASASDMTTALAAKADKVANATNNNFAALDGNGNLKDSGKKATDFANSIPSGSPSGAIVIVSNSGQIGRSDKTLSDLMPATTIDTTPTADSDHLVTSGGVKAALDGKRTLVGQTISLVVSGQEIEIESSDVPNLIRALSDPDNTPTLDSTKLVTSGGVAGTIEDATTLSAYVAQTSSKPSINDIFGDRPVKRVDVAIQNSTGEDASLSDLFRVGSGQTLVEADNAVLVPAGSTALVHIYKALNGFFFLEAHSLYTLS